MNRIFNFQLTSRVSKVTASNLFAFVLCTLFMWGAMPVCAQTIVTQLPGAAIQVASCANGSVWCLGTAQLQGGGYPIFYWNGGAWIQTDGAAIKIAISPMGQAWVIGPDGTIWRRDVNVWTQIPGSASDIAIGGDGVVWILGATPLANGDYPILRFDGTNWIALDGYANKIASSATGQAWVISVGNTIWRRDGNLWTKVQGHGTSLACSPEGLIYHINNFPEQTGGGNGIMYGDGSYWTKLQGTGGVVSLAAGPGGVLYATNNQNLIFQIIRTDLANSQGMNGGMNAGMNSGMNGGMNNGMNGGMNGNNMNGGMNGNGVYGGQTNGGQQSPQVVYVPVPTPAPTPPPAPVIVGCKGNVCIGDGDLSNTISTLQAISFDADRMSSARLVIPNYCFTTGQILQLMALFSFSADQVSLAKFTYPYCTDPQNYWKLSTSLSFSSDQENLNNFIKNGGK